VERVQAVRSLQALADRTRTRGGRIALVPTLGALHAGHMALVAEARRRADVVVVSIFVNRAQFNAAADFAAYPRTLEADLALCREAGVDVVFTPSDVELYGEGYQTWIDVEELAKPLCGASRPGHFRGVATVVAKLLLAAKPHLALFGEKDFQQLALIRRLTTDLGFDVEIVGVPTVREADGLALSSRNVQLTAATRAQAQTLAAALAAVRGAVARGERDRGRLEELAVAEIARAPLAKLDYAELRDPRTLARSPERVGGDTLLALAVFFPKPGGGSVRLIDNCVVGIEKE
jgi:pantoate--beta-alanine ligase